MADTPQDPRMFWYASFSGLWVYFQTDAKGLANYLSDATGGLMKPMPLDGKGAVNLCFMSYASHSGINEPAAYTSIEEVLPDPVPDRWLPPGFGVEPTNECELNAVSLPGNLRAPENVTTLRQFVLGADVTKVVGHFRLRVPCDDRIAVFYGKNFIGENKVLTHPFRYNVPALNNPGQTEWSLTVPGALAGPASGEMFTLNVDVSGLPSVAANTSELVNYNMSSGNTLGVVQQRRNLFGAFHTCFLDQPGAQGRVTLRYGDSSDPMIKGMRTLLGDRPVALVVQTFTSMPAATETPTIPVASGA